MADRSILLDLGTGALGVTIPNVDALLTIPGVEAVAESPRIEAAATTPRVDATATTPRIAVAASIVGGDILVTTETNAP